MSLVANSVYSTRLALALLIGCSVTNSICFAHVDRVIELKEDGSIVGLPSEYGPGNLRVVFSPYPLGGKRKVIISEIFLQLGKNNTHLPKCVTGLINTQSKDNVQATASWYHDETPTLPYYLNVDFFNPGHLEKNFATPGYSLLFNLHTGKLIRMEVHIAGDDGRISQEVPVDLRSRCSQAEYESFLMPLAN